MRYEAFIGSSYESQAITADCEDLHNWYPEMLQSPGATSKTVLYPTPGVDALSSAPTGVGRGHIAINGREFAVIGTKFYEVDSGGALVERGTVAIDEYPATISSNGDIGDQLWITSGGNGYCYELTANTLTQVVSMNGRCTMGAFLDGYFLALDSNTSTLHHSDLADGQTWTPGSVFAQRSLAPDRWVSMVVASRFIWLYGTQTSEVWFDSGAASFPFEPHPSGLIQYGIAAPWSAKVLGTDAAWVGVNAAGRICALMSQGFTPKLISTYPWETQVSTYKGIVSAIADAYSERGHTFYMVNFDAEGVTWVFDTETGFWHKRGSWHPDLKRFKSWRPRYIVRGYGQLRCLDASGPTVYKIGANLTGDVDGLEIRRVRRAPAIMDENKRIFYSSFELDIEPGLGSGEGGQITTEDVEWTDLTLALAVGSTISKNVEFSDVWEAGGVSVSTIVASGWAQFINIQPATMNRIFGLSSDSGTIVDPDAFPFAFLTDAGSELVVVQESGVVKWTGSGPLDTGDVVRIEVNASGLITYLINGATVYTSESVAPFPLYVHAAFGTDDAQFTNVTMANTLPAPPEYDPVVMMRMSDDGGKTWGIERMRPAGKMGEYKKRIRWDRLGAARRRVFEVSVSAPIPWRITGAYLEASGQLPRSGGGA